MKETRQQRNERILAGLPAPERYPMHVWVSASARKLSARTLKELRRKAGAGAVSKMYLHRGDKTYHIGYVIGWNWWTRYAPVEIEQ